MRKWCLRAVFSRFSGFSAIFWVFRDFLGFSRFSGVFRGFGRGPWRGWSEDLFWQISVPELGTRDRARGKSRIPEISKNPYLVTFFSWRPFFRKISGHQKNRKFAGRVEKWGVLAKSRRKISVPRILGVKKKTFGLDHGRAFFQKLVA